LVVWLVDSCCSLLEHWAFVKRFVSLQFLNLRHSVGLLGPVISPSQGRYLKQIQIDIHASNGIRNHDPSVRVSEDSSCLRPRGHCDRQVEKKLVVLSALSNQFRLSNGTELRVFKTFAFTFSLIILTTDSIFTTTYAYFVLLDINKS
jgi:hypothetical protein